MNLSEGSIEALMKGEEVNYKPVLQILGYKKIPGGAAERYRMLVSDGRHSHSFAMLATQLNDRLLSGELDNYAVVRVEKHICNQVQGDKRVLIILDVTVLRLGTDVGRKLGNPQPVFGSSGSSGPVASNEQTVKNETKTNNEINRPQNSFRNTAVTTPTKNQNSSTAVSPSLSNARIFPIESITPFQNRWTIRARVMNRSGIKTWSNSRGDGKLFSVDLADETGEIRAVGFNDQCDKFYNVFEVNKVFYISNAFLKSANKNFSTIKNDYEMTLKNETIVEPCNDNCSSVPVMQYAFVPIAELEHKGKDEMVDVIGVCKSTNDVQTITGRTNGRQFKKRDITLVDQSNRAVQVTLWAEEAEKFEGSGFPVVCVKGAKVGDFGGINLSTMMSSIVQINPDIKEAHVLKGWYEREGTGMDVESLSGKGPGGGGVGATNWKTFSQVLDEKLGMGSKPDYYTCKATIVLIKKENCMYQACSSENCNKKVIDMNNGTFRCEKCNQDVPDFKWRLLMSANLSDFSGNQWVTCFQETAESILGKTSAEMGEMRQVDENLFQQVFSNANFGTYIFKLRSKMETFNDENRLKTHVVAVTPMNYRTYCRKLLDDLQK